jgi:hypothetical protein
MPVVFSKKQPDGGFLVAAKVLGIKANQAYP